MYMLKLYFICMYVCLKQIFQQQKWRFSTEFLVVLEYYPR